MNYKEAMRAWLDNPNIELEWFSDSTESWISFSTETIVYAPLFIVEADYRIKTNPLKARVAKFISDNDTTVYYRLIMECEFSDTEKRIDFVNWSTDLLELK